MVSDDISEVGPNLQHYVETWKALGFDVSSIEEKLDTLNLQQIEEFQQLIDSALSLQERLEPFTSSVHVQEMNHHLENPNQFEMVQERFIQWIADNAPWEAGYYRWYSNWSENDQSQSQYWNIIDICAGLDESSWTSLDLLLPLMSTPENYPNIVNELEQLVEDEDRQRILLEKAVTQLKEKGYDVQFNSMKIIDQFDEIERMQTYSNRIDLLKLEIQSSILPYDPVLADTFTTRADDLIKSPSDDVTTIENNVHTISEHLQTRLNEMNALIQKWYSEGYSYEERTRILPEELLEWEHLLPEIEQRYHRHVGAFERWKEITKLWQYEDSGIDRIAGKLEHTDAFLDKIDALEQQWTEKELQGSSLIERWEQLGFEMDVWRYKITQDPRQGLAELNQQLPSYERANELLERMLQLDTSLGGEEEVERRSVILRTMDLENDLLDEMEDWIERRTVRNTRHRRMLQSEWEEAVRRGKVDANTTFSDLYSFEEAIASLEHHDLSKSVSAYALERSKTELLRLEERGWNITELLDLHEHHPEAFFHQFSQAMDAITRIQSIQRRISGLDWRRDPNRGDELATQVRNPMELVKIEQQIPALIRYLADRPIEDEAYTFLAWMPKQRPVLLPREQSRIRKEPAKAQPQSTLEEAHEAMLEAMDTEPETDDEEASAKPNNAGHRMKSLEEERRHPDTKHLHDDGVSDEEFFADDKWSVERWSWWRERQNELKLARKEAEETAKSMQTTPLSLGEDIKLIEEEKEHVVEEKKTVVAPTSTSVVEGDLTSYERLLRLIGLTEEANVLAGSGDVSVVRRALASHVGTEPRDVRVDRLLRLTLRLLPQGDQGDGERSKMIDAIGEILPKYNQWVRMRLEARHMGASGDFFEDALRLGTALNRTPGPGVKVPLQADTFPLPESTNLNDLDQQTERLVQSMNLPAAGGIN